MARTIATGRGKVYARLAVEGWPYIFCTDHRMEKTFSNGQIQAVGLNLDGVRLSCQAVIERAEVRADGFQAQIADVAGKGTLAFGKRRQQTTELTVELSTSATTATVQSTAGFAAAGVIHVNTEAMTYSGKTSTTFAGLTRGVWGTVAQKHYIGSGERLAPPRVTDLPEALGGRRVWLYLYDDGDGVIKDPSTFTAPAAGDASIRWRGIATTDVNYTAGLWSFMVDPLTAILGQSIGGDLEEGVKIRGFYFPWTDPIVVMLVLSEPGSGENIIDSTYAEIVCAGHFETVDDLIDEMNSQLATITAGSEFSSRGFGTSTGDAQVIAMRSPDGVMFQYYTNTVLADVQYLRMVWLGGGTLSAAGESSARMFWYGRTADKIRSTDVDAGKTYISDSVWLPEAFCAVGRGATAARGPSGAFNPAGPRPDYSVSAPDGRVYLAGDLALESNMAFFIEGDGGGKYAVLVGVNAADNYIEVRANKTYLTQKSTLKFGRNFRQIAAGPARDIGTTVSGFRQALIEKAPDLVNVGACPLVTDSEMPSAAWDGVVEDAIAGLGVGGNRDFIAFEGHQIGEIIGADLALIGCYLSINSTGQIVPKRLRFAPETAYRIGTLTARNVGGEFPTAARSGIGQIGEVLIRSGYDPVADEWNGVTVRVRDVQNASLNRLASGKKLEIKPRSVSGGYDGTTLEFDPRDAERMARPILGIFSAPYESWTLQADVTKMDISVGDSVLVTSSLIPAMDGTVGITKRAALVVGWQYEPLSGRATFDLIATSSPIAGYAPSFLVLAPINVTGNQWAITCSIASYATGDGVDWLPAGARVRVQKANATEDSIAGVVDSWSTVTCTVTLDSAWTPGSDRWYLSSGTAADSITSDQELFCYMGDTLRSIPFSTPKVSRELAP